MCKKYSFFIFYFVMENKNELCSICYEELSENAHALECGHKYHCSCIINWFRKDHNNCPLCNDTTINEENMPWNVKIKTIEEIKKLGRRKDCPKNIKKTLNKIKKIKEDTKKNIMEAKEIKKEFDEFKKTNKEILKSYKTLQNKYFNKRSFRWKNKRKIRKIESELLAQIQITPIYLKK